MSANPAAPLMLDYVYEHERKHPERVYLVQPVGDGKVVEYTWGEVMNQARCMASHLMRQGLPAGSKIAILSKNCAHFFMAELAIWMAGATTVAIFPTEGAETINFVLTHSDAAMLFVGKLDDWPQQAAGVPAQMPRIALPLAPNGSGRPWAEIVAEHEPLHGHPVRAADDLAMLIYTSGSTGQPKGVMHSFGGVTRTATTLMAAVACTPEDRFLSYLPLAHVVERAYIASGSMVVGCRVYFAERVDTFLADLQRAQPTLFISVPRLWLKFQQGVFAKIPPARLDMLLRIPLLGKLVGRKILRGLGLEHVRLAGSGSAPIPAELIAWYRRLGLNLMEGYGMSEDFALSHMSTPEHSAAGCVGVPFDGVKVRISEDGEVLIKSPGRMVGYYKRPDLDAESFTRDGYFRTGDRGELTADGLLRLTGRLKELFKTAKGKYVAPAPIENLLVAHPMIELAMVSGSGQPAAYALVILAEQLRQGMHDAAQRQSVESQLAALLNELNGQVANYEQLQMLVVSPEVWSIENGMLTPTLKIRRNRIEAAVGARVPQWYAAGRPVVWA